jgi:hypothetical protein
MDNGLIFPYPCTAVQAEPHDAKLPGDALGLIGVAALKGSRRAVGETQEASSTGRWLSRGKDVGRSAGKSADHGPEI